MKNIIIPNLTVGEYETILYALEQRAEAPGLSGPAYKNLIQKLERLQNNSISLLDTNLIIDAIRMNMFTKPSNEDEEEHNRKSEEQIELLANGETL